jgi:hypothetical protein
MAPTFGWSAYARRHSRLVLSTLAATLIAAMPATAVAKVGPHREANAANRTDAFYTETNTRANAVLVFKRNPDGTFGQPVRVQTGGRGIDATPINLPTVDGSGSVNLTPDGRLVFVVNAATTR